MRVGASTEPIASPDRWVSRCDVLRRGGGIDRRASRPRRKHGICDHIEGALRTSACRPIDVVVQNDDTPQPSGNGGKRDPFRMGDGLRMSMVILGRESPISYKSDSGTETRTPIPLIVRSVYSREKH